MNPNDGFVSSFFQCDDDFRHAQELIAGGEIHDPLLIAAAGPRKPQA
jgi:hypothetical protein